jgi:hypothetical protein
MQKHQQAPLRLAFVHTILLTSQYHEMNLVGMDFKDFITYINMVLQFFAAFLFWRHIKLLTYEHTTFFYFVNFITKLFQNSSIPHWSVFFTSSFHWLPGPLGPHGIPGPSHRKLTRRKLKVFFTSQGAY